MPLEVGDRETSGRTLFVSLPLRASSTTTNQRVFSANSATTLAATRPARGAQPEADAVRLLQCAAALGRRFGRRVTASRSAPRIFEIALKQSSRRREFAADSVDGRFCIAAAVVRAW